jgi:hypothetical protein
MDGASAQVPTSPGTREPEPPPLLRDQVEVVLQINGRQVRALQRWQDWLYFTGGIDGSGTFRIPKDSSRVTTGGEALAPWCGSSVPEIYHVDATHIYWLDCDVIYRQGLDDTIESVQLGERFYVLSGDGETVFTVNASCTRIALLDKGTLTLQVLSPAGATDLGSNMTAASNGERVFCTGPRPKTNEPPRTTADYDDVLYIVDKATTTVSTVVIPREGPEPFNFRESLFADGALWAIASGRLGVIHIERGDFEVRDQWIYSPASLEWDAKSDWVYVETTSNVIRYNPLADKSEYVVEPIFGSADPGFTQDDEYVYWVQRRQDPEAAVLHEDGTVQSIAHDGLEDAIVRIKKPVP